MYTMAEHLTLSRWLGEVAVAKSQIWIASACIVLLANVTSALADQPITGQGPPPIPDGDSNSSQKKESSSKNTVNYYVDLNGQKDGPFSLEDLLTRAQRGNLKADALVWKSGLKEWVKAGDLDELKTALGAADGANLIKETLSKNGWWTVYEKSNSDYGSTEALTFFRLYSDGSSKFGQTIKYSFQRFPRTRMMEGTWDIVGESKDGFELVMNNDPSTAETGMKGTQTEFINEELDRFNWARARENENFKHDYRIGVDGTLEETDGTPLGFSERCPCKNY